MKAQCFSVIIAGGKGTRFWPLSRSLRPKQLLKIFGRRSLIGETANRVLSISGRKRTLVVTVVEQLNALRKELRHLPRKNFLAEPQGNNTAPCIGLAALEVATRDPAAVMVVLPADHWVVDVDGFRNTLNSAIEIAMRHDGLITIGIRPDYPETGYGYIMKGSPLRGEPGAYHVKRFREKPSRIVAQRWIRQGSLWNSGIFVWKAATLLALMRDYQPQIAEGLGRIKAAARGRSLGDPTAKIRDVVARQYKKMPNISIDYAVLEKAGSEGKVIALEADFGWSDVGSWAAVHRLLAHDENGNAGTGKWLTWGARNSLIHANDRLVVLLGVENTVVVDTPDALLVGDINRSQEVRELVDELKRKGYGAYTLT
ncbi:MAG TPA: mannose-1-phosphate guanylyltransferase [Candidatus Binatia bacterium]|nr:mannose-1-phosphate guanylyltransferase [Candidatus Binatia bacterium]